MRRVVIIGNGFDKAHDLRTGYTDFINDYWASVISRVINRVALSFDVDNVIEPFEDDFVGIEKKNSGINKRSEYQDYTYSDEGDQYGELCRIIEWYNKRFPYKVVSLKFKNNFFERIVSHCSLLNWVDIENEYYEALKGIALETNFAQRREKVRVLNGEFRSIQDLLEQHLTGVFEEAKIEPHKSIEEVFKSYIHYDDVATTKRDKYVQSVFEVMSSDSMFPYDRDIENDVEYAEYFTEEKKRFYFVEKHKKNERFLKKYCVPSTLILNFNYTPIAKRYYLDTEHDYEVVNIHGELNSKENPIVFGYGDELDRSYSMIEQLQDNEFLENIKSIKYHQTRNYKKVLDFIEAEVYQVLIMGHSCGNSDRTLLNTLFEHENCISIKVYYKQEDDGSDNYSDMIKNISRNFSNKVMMRDVVVNRDDCSALIPCEKKFSEDSL